MAFAKDLYRALRRIWGRFPLISGILTMLVLLVLLVWLPRGVLIVPGILLFVLSVWFFSFAPAACLARTREGTRCRNNSRGLVGGCHIVQHQNQTVLDRLKPNSALPSPETRDVVRNLNAILGSTGSFVGGVVAVVAFLTR
jgi:hypothetical protein